MKKKMLYIVTAAVLMFCSFFAGTKSATTIYKNDVVDLSEVVAIETTETGVYMTLENRSGYYLEK